jgi:hypothetical protein
LTRRRAGALPPAAATVLAALAALGSEEALTLALASVEEAVEDLFLRTGGIFGRCLENVVKLETKSFLGFEKKSSKIMRIFRGL